MYYISIDELDYLGVPSKTINNGTSLYRNKKSLSWRCKKAPNDSRKILIDIDTIPATTRKKYNIPSGAEYYNWKLEQSIKETERKFKEFEEKKAQRDKEEKERKEKELAIKNDLRKQALKDAFEKNYGEYLLIYENRYSYNATLKNLVIKSAREHAFWLQMLEITGTKYKSYDGGCKVGFELYLFYKEHLKLSRNIKNESFFRIVISKMRALWKDDKCISDLVASNKFKPRELKKTNEFHRSLALSFLSHPNKYCYRVVADLVNHHCVMENYPEITESWIKQLVIKDNEFKTTVKSVRNGDKWVTDNLIQHANRKNVEFPANVWMIDGSPLQFLCTNESGNKKIRLNLFVVLDVCSRKIVGFDIAYSEDKYNIINALKMAVREEGHLPAEIVSDNFSASKSEEVLALKKDFEKMGTVWRHAKVGNPQDKAYVERFFGAFQSVECTLHDDYQGEGIMSKRDNRRSAEYLMKTIKRDGLPTFKQMKDKAIQLIIKYNERQKRKAKSPNEIYKTFPKPNAREVNQVRSALLFWNRTKATIRKSMIKIVVNKEEHFYEVKDHKISTALHGKQVFVRYDEKQLDRIMIFDLKSETVICECKKCIEIVTSYIERTPEDDKNLHKIAAKQKSKKEYLKSEYDRIIREGLEKVGKESLDLIHPSSLKKNQINDKESLELLERLRIENGITNDDEFTPTTKPLMRISIKKEKTYEDFNEIKKEPFEEGSLKPVQT